jgi:hypothetical protein
MFLVLAFMTFSFSSCDKDDVVNYADDLPGTYESISGAVNVEGAINVITLSSKGDSEALTKNLIVKITDKDTQKIAGIETIRYSTNDNDVDITRVGDIITLRVTSAEYVQNSTNIYIGTKRVK